MTAPGDSRGKSGASRPRVTRPRSPRPELRARDRGDDLLLIMGGVGAVVVAGCEGGVVQGGFPRGSGGVAEVVAEERGLAGRAVHVRCVELRVVGIRADPDVMPDRGQCWAVELDAGVDAVVGGASIQFYSPA